MIVARPPRLPYFQKRDSNTFHFGISILAMFGDGIGTHAVCFALLPGRELILKLARPLSGVLELAPFLELNDRQKQEICRPI